MKKPTTEFHALDAFRGLCAVFVALFHVGWVSHFKLSPFVANGWLFVDFFFILSGFVIAHNYLVIQDATTLRAFIVRRFFRLYPLHLFTFLLAIAATVVGLYIKSGGDFSPIDWMKSELINRRVLESLLLVQALGFSEPSFNTPSWSISAELWTYLIFGLLSLSFRAPARIVGALATLGVIAFAYLLAANWPRGAFTALDFGFPRCLSSFALGVLVHSLCRNHASSIGGQFVMPAYAVVFATLYAALTFVDTESPTNLVVLPLFACIVGLAAVDSGSIIRRLLEAKWARKLGEISYSIYMVHTIVYMVVSFLVTSISPRLKEATQSRLELFAGDFYCVLYISITLGVSILTFRYIEKPWRELGRKLGNLSSKDQPHQTSSRITL